jgi:hypothetical protein
MKRIKTVNFTIIIIFAHNGFMLRTLKNIGRVELIFS